MKLPRLFKHRHKWQTRARSRYGNPTYQVCIKCGEARQWLGGINGDWVLSVRLEEFDNQFDENNKYIFK